MAPPAFDAWLSALEARCLADLRFADVSRALRALSSAYVERRGAPAARRVLDGAGKRAAFALYYAPRHFLLIHEAIAALPSARDAVTRVIDIGCGTGVAGAAWACQTRPAAAVLAIDRHPWALTEAAWTCRTLGLSAGVRHVDLAAGRLPRTGSGDAAIAAFAVNELPPAARDALLARLLAAASAGTKVLIVEPIAVRVAPWWPQWTRAFESAGGRAAEWRIAPSLPAIVARLGAAAGLSQDYLTARTLSLNL